MRNTDFIKPLSSFYKRKFFLALLSVWLLLQLGFSVSALAAGVQVDESDSLEKIKADYQVKASFFPLPVKARISVERVEQDLYKASIAIKSPVFRVTQSEIALIKNCEIALQRVESKGKRVGAEAWDEAIRVTWPEKQVYYQNNASGKDSQAEEARYRAEYTPTGFVSYFAHQFTSIHKQENKKALSYIQSTKGWRTDYQYMGIDKNTENRFFDDAVSAHRFITPRPGMDEADMPQVWFSPEALGAFPLKMTMKLGVFTMEVSLKKLAATPEEVGSFFEHWQCVSL